MMKHQIRFEVGPEQYEFFFPVEQESEWLLLQFASDQSMTWEEIRFSEPGGKQRFLYWDVHSPREAVLHASPVFTSYLGVPGSIPSGRWQIEFKIGKPCTFTLEWEYGSGALPASLEIPSADRDFWTDGASPDRRHFALNQYDWQAAKCEEARWYRGDFHTHTTLSDGKMTPEQATRLAEEVGLDFFVATEHNTLPSAWPKSRLLVIPGAELTSHSRGDWNAIGLTQSIDYWSNVDFGRLERTEEDFTARMNQLREQVGALGAIRSLNHPLIGRFAWKAPGTLLSGVDALEIWQTPVMKSHLAPNEGALLLWTILWNAGYQLSGIGGSDTHYFPHEPFHEGEQPQVIGDPATCVWAPKLTAAHILQGVRNRHVYVTRGPQLEAQIQVGEPIFRFGDDLTEALQRTSGSAVCRLRVAGAKGASLHLVVNGDLQSRREVANDQETFEDEFDWQSSSYVWARYECRDEQGHLLAVTNPFFAGKKEKEIFTWQEVLDRAYQVDPDLRQLVEGNEII